MAGEWTQRGRKYPMTFRRYDPSKIAAAPPIPKELEGFWEGRIKVGGVIEMRLVLRIEKQKDGRLKAMLASPDQGANQIPISSISLVDGTLKFESKLIGAKYSGKKTKDGTAFEGEFNQGGTRLPLTLKKTDKFSLTLRPQTPKPPFPYRTEHVRYENKAGGVTLAGTLSIPQGKGPFPAVLMITGSGAQDRDETILGHKPFFVIADALAVAGLRCFASTTAGSAARRDRSPARRSTTSPATSWPAWPSSKDVPRSPRPGSGSSDTARGASSRRWRPRDRAMSRSSS